MMLAASLITSATPVCPNTANTNTDCGALATINPDGSVIVTPVAGANPYDGSDDALVGIINNSGSTFNGSFTLSGSGNGGGLFAFDGDGICSFVTASYCATARTGYEGPGVTFSNINAAETSGTVNVANLLAGATTYFSLEGSPASIAPNLAPEPTTMSLFGLGAAGAFLAYRRRKHT